MNNDPVAWLYGLQHFGVKLGLDNIRALLDLLEHPERAYRSILVAGTNGKGSVAAMLESLLRAHGSNSGLFSSPHLVRPNERIRINGEDIATPDLQHHLSRLRATIAAATGSERLAAHPSFFEVITAAALQAFGDAGLDCAVLEVGMGGRLDATNAVEADLSVVVTVDYDHVEKLGPTLEKIAAEKAAIVKRGRPLVTGATQPEVLRVIQSACHRAGASFYEARQLAELDHGSAGGFTVRTAAQQYDRLILPLPGSHQRENARTAIAALEIFARETDLQVDPDRVRQGLGQVRWPGRLQWIDGDPPLLLDGAHNPAGARALADYLRTRPEGRTVALFGAMRKKAVEATLNELAPRIDAVVVTRPSVERAGDPEEIAAAARGRIDVVEVEPDAAAALRRARELAPPGGFVLVTGSLYLVGEILGLLQGEPAAGPVSM